MYIENEENSVASSEVNKGKVGLLTPSGREQRTEDPTQNNPVGQIRDLLGRDVILLPVKKGQKAPIDTNWQDTAMGLMATSEYLARLEGGNIGVLLGSKSGGLCAIDIDSDEQVEPFLELNPNLKATLRTKGKRGSQIWVRISGSHEKLRRLKTVDGHEWGEWRADGGQSVIYGIHPEGMPYQIENNAKPVELRFSEIKWPDHIKLPWIKTDAEMVEAEEGAPFQFPRGGVVINQMYFVKKYTLEHEVKFDSNLNDFFQYDPNDGLWKKKSIESIKRQFLDDLGRAARDGRVESLHFKRTDQTANNLTNLLRSTVEEQNLFKERPKAIHVANGMIRFGEDGGAELCTVHPSFLSRNRCPYAFADDAECPRFLDELLRPALDEDDISLLQKWAGAVLLGRNAAQRFMLLLGTPGGGKSTLMAILERIIGSENVAQMRTEHLTERFEIFGYNGKTLLTGKDVPSDFLMHRGAPVLKALVGQDLLEAEKKGSNQRVQLVGDFNVGITCNADLNIRLQGDAGAWRRRMLVIRYENEPPKKRIAEFAEQLLATEGPGILRWMVDGAMALLENLKHRGDYSLTPAQTDRIDSLMNQSDSVRKFVREGVVRKDGASITNEALVGAYFEFCDLNHWVPFPGKDARTELIKQMLAVHKVSNRHDIPDGQRTVRGFKHVALKVGEDRK